jgi:signal transduction histidine kinase
MSFLTREPGPRPAPRPRRRAARRERRTVADLVVQLGEAEPGQVRGLIAGTLGDPTLQLGLWYAADRTWVDEQGRELQLPTSDGVTFIGQELAVLIHDPRLLEQPELVESVGAAASLALENERLQAALRAQLREARESRERIVRGGDQERRRLERDLHDGAQQRLLGLGLALQLLKKHTLDAGADANLATSMRALQHALSELRELARGIHPAILTDRGLATALATLATQAPIPVSVDCDPERFPAHVETTSYLVVAEALANVTNHGRATAASVSVRRQQPFLVVEVRDDGIGGADASGPGLVALTDRVGALGGTFSIDSPPDRGTRLLAKIPVDQ